MNFDGGTIVAALTVVVSISSGAVGLYVRAMRAELVLRIERTRAEVIAHINTSYVRKEQCALREEGIRELLGSLRREAGLAE